MSTYAWRPGRNYRANPDEAQEVFVKLKETVGLTSHSILREARRRGSPLHGDFEWDDGVAGPLYRLIQARKLVRAIIKVDPKKDPQDTDSVWVHTTDEGGEGMYESPLVVVRDPTLLSNAIHEARQYLRAGERRWQHLREVTRGFAAARKAFDDEVE